VPAKVKLRQGPEQEPEETRLLSLCPRMLQEQMYILTAIKGKCVCLRLSTVPQERIFKEPYSFKIKPIGLTGKAMREFSGMENGIGLQQEIIAEKDAWT